MTHLKSKLLITTIATVLAVSAAPLASADGHMGDKAHMTEATSALHSMSMDEKQTMWNAMSTEEKRAKWSTLSKADRKMMKNVMSEDDKAMMKSYKKMGSKKMKDGHSASDAKGMKMKNMSAAERKAMMENMSADEKAMMKARKNAKVVDGKRMVDGVMVPIKKTDTIGEYLQDDAKDVRSEKRAIAVPGSNNTITTVTCPVGTTAQDDMTCLVTGDYKFN